MPPIVTFVLNVGKIWHSQASATLALLLILIISKTPFPSDTTPHNNKYEDKDKLWQRPSRSEGQQGVYLEVGVEADETGRGEGEGEEVGQRVPVPELAEHQQAHHGVHVGVARAGLQRHRTVTTS